MLSNCRFSEVVSLEYCIQKQKAFGKNYMDSTEKGSFVKDSFYKTNTTSIIEEFANFNRN